MYDNEHTIIKHKCQTCDKIIATYTENHVIDWDAASICKKCFDKIKYEMQALINEISQKKSNKIDIYSDNF